MGLKHVKYIICIIIFLRSVCSKKEGKVGLIFEAVSQKSGLLSASFDRLCLPAVS